MPDYYHDNDDGNAIIILIIIIYSLAFITGKLLAIYFY